MDSVRWSYNQFILDAFRLSNGSFSAKKALLRGFDKKIFGKRAKRDSLHSACFNGRYDVSIRLIRQFRLNPNVRDKYGNTALHYACNSGRIKLVMKLILSYNCDLLLPNNNGDTPLHWACRSGNVELVMKLISSCKYDPLLPNNDTPLHCAIIERSSLMVQLLVSKCGRSSLAFHLVKGSIMTTAWEFWDDDIIKCLINECKHGLGIMLQLCLMNIEEYDNRLEFVLNNCYWDPNVQDRYGNTALHYACESGNVKLVTKLILSYKCDPLLPNNDGDTPIHYSIIERNSVIVQSLVSIFGHDLLSNHTIRESVLTTAWEFWDDGIIKCLINACRCGLGTMILQLCIINIEEYGNRLKFVLDNNCNCDICHCDPNVQDEYGDTALHDACRCGNAELVLKLISLYNFDPFLRNNDGNTPLHYACESGNVELVMKLISCSTYNYDDPPLQLCNEYGITPLHCACKSGNVELIMKLISKCVPLLCNTTIYQHCVHFKLPNKYAALHKACQCVNEIVVKKLTLLYKCVCFLHNVDAVGIRLCRKKVPDIEFIEEKPFNAEFQSFCFTPLHYPDTKRWKLQRTDYGCGEISNKYILSNEGGCGLCILLFQCIIKKYHSKLKFILDKYFHCNIQDKSGNTLHICASNGDLNIFNNLVTKLNCNNNPDIENNKGETPLHIICSSIVKQGYSDDRCKTLFHLLIDKKVSPHIKFNDSDISVLSAVCKAITNGNHFFYPSILHYLIIDCGCDPSNDSDLILYTLCNTVRLYKFQHIDFLIELVVGMKIGPYLTLESGRKVCIMCCPIPKFPSLSKSYLDECDGVCHNLHHPICNMISIFINTTFLETLCAFINNQQNITVDFTNHVANLFCFFFTNVECECHFHPQLIECVNKLYSHITNLPVLRKIITTFGFLHQIGSGDYLDTSTLNRMIQKSAVSKICFQNPLHSARIIICCLKPYSSSIYSLFYHLINSSEFNLMNKADKFGNTLLHLACLFYHGDSTLIEYLLLASKTDPLCVNDYQQTPLTLLALSSKDMNNELNIQELVAKFGELKVSHPIESYVNIIILGNPGVGKSTLVKVINDRHMHDALFRQFRSVTGVELCTAGIVPHVLNDKDMGCVIIHDLAGQVEYYSSHTAVLSNLLQGSAAVFVIVVSLADEKSTESLEFWLSVVENASSKASEQYHVFVVVSHYDAYVTGKTAKLSSLKNPILKHKLSDTICHTNIFRLDCRKLGGGQLNSLMSSLSDACESVRSDNIREMSLYCHMLYDFLSSREITVYTLNELIETIKAENDYFLPTAANRLFSIIQSLSSTGLIMYLGGIDNPGDKVWIIANKSVLLENLNGVLFAPEYFKEHIDQLVSKTGIVKLSKLSEHCSLKYSYDPDMIVQFLESMELSHEISKDFILSSNLAPSSKSVINERYLFIPALIENSNKPDNMDQFQFGWCLQCSDVHSFFLSQFIHLIILHLLKYTETRSSEEPIDKHCHIWNNGIYWETRRGVSVLVELFNTHKSIILLISFESGCYEQMTVLRKAIIGDILSCKRQVLLKTSIEEFVIDNTDLQYPQILDRISDFPLYSVHEFCECFYSGEEFVLSLSGKRKAVNVLLKGTNIKEQCESVLAGRNPKNLAELLCSSPTEFNHVEVSAICESQESSRTQQSMPTEQQDGKQSLPNQIYTVSDLSCSNIFNILRNKTAQWDSIGRELGVGLNDRTNLQRDITLDYSGRLERVINIWLESSPSWDQFITALRNLRYNDIIRSITKEQCEPLSPDGQYSETSSSNVTPALESVDHYSPQTQSLQFLHQDGPQDDSVAMNSHKTTARVEQSRGSSNEDLQIIGNGFHNIDGCVVCSSSTTGSPTVDCVLLRYKPKLIEIVGDPTKLAVELVAKDLLSQSIQVRVSTTLGISIYDKANMIIDEIVRYFQQHDSDVERFLKFCQVLKDHGQPGLDKLAEEMEQLASL